MGPDNEENIKANPVEEFFKEFETNLKKESTKAIDKIFKKFQLLMLKILLISVALLLTLAIISKYSPGAELGGKTIYNQYCASCHGVDGKNTIWGIPVDFTKNRLDMQQIIQTTIQGKRKLSIIYKMPITMPSFKDNLTEEQIKKVSEYVKSFQK